jgi:hypothetical protein
VPHAGMRQPGPIAGRPEGTTLKNSTRTGSSATNPDAAAPQVQAEAVGNALQTLLVEATMDDVLGRVAMVREFERAPGTGARRTATRGVTRSATC